MKSRVLRSRDAREIVALGFAELGQDAMAAFRDVWPNGAMNPTAIDEQANVLQAAQHGVNISQAQRELIGTAPFHPGFQEAD